MFYTSTGILAVRCVCVLSRSVVLDSLWPHGLQPARLLCPWGFSRQEYCSELPFPSPGDLPNPGIQPRSPALQADSLPFETPGKVVLNKLPSFSVELLVFNISFPTFASLNQEYFKPRFNFICQLLCCWWKTSFLCLSILLIYKVKR